MKKFLNILYTLFLVIVCTQILTAQVRVKELVNVQGIRENSLIGYGLVVGLNGSGDSPRSKFTIQSVSNMLERFGVKVDPGQIRLKNVAAVMVTATLDNLVKPGQRIDVHVSSIGDAKSLEGGTLLLTPLAGQDGNVYVMAQGAVTVGGFNLQTTGGGGVRQNYTLVGQVNNGGLVQDKWENSFKLKPIIALSLKEPDFKTANEILLAINGALGDTVATAQDPSTIIVRLPKKFQTPTGSLEAMALIQDLTVTPDVPARVVINERTGTVVVGGNVTILPVAVAHGNLSVEIRSNPIVSQPNAFSQGQTVVVPNTQATVYQDNNQMVSINGASTVQDVAQALNTLGLGPRDIIAVLQAIKRAGALKADLIVM